MDRTLPQLRPADLSPKEARPPLKTTSYMCIYVYVYLSISISLSLSLYIYMYIFIHVYIYIYICRDRDTCIHITCMYIYIYISIHIYTYIYIYVYIHPFCGSMTPDAFFRPLFDRHTGPSCGRGQPSALSLDPSSDTPGF